MERFVYEVRPYLFLVIGMVALAAQKSPLMNASSVLLVATALYVFKQRAHHRGVFANVRIRP